MTLSYWNQQFQFSKILADFDEYLESMRRRSAEVSGTFERSSYGSDPRQFFELFGKPQHDGILPVFIHGGYWRALEAETHRFVLPALSKQTGCVANLEYRLLPHVALADIVADTLTGLRQLARQTQSRLLVIGHSAGGHLSVTAAHALPDIVSGAVAVSGIYDLAPLQFTFLADEVGLKAEDLEGFSPQVNWTGRDARNVVVVVGSRETGEFHRQAQMFADTNCAQLIEVHGAHHMTLLDDLADPNGIICAKINALIAAFEKIST